MSKFCKCFNILQTFRLIGSECDSDIFTLARMEVSGTRKEGKMVAGGPLEPVNIGCRVVGEGECDLTALLYSTVTKL